MIESKSTRPIEACRGPRPVSEPSTALARDGGDACAAREDESNTVVEAVRDEDVVVTVQGDAMRPVEPRLMALPVGTTGMAGAASNRRDAAACGNADLADTRVVV
jgi:hypothetical protein